MNDEELQHRLRRLDPSAGVSVHPAGGPRAALLMEQIMNTATATPTATATRATTPPSSPRRWPRFALIGTAAAALIGGAAVGLGAFGGGSSATTSVHYQLGEQADPLTTMCLAVTDYQPPAGTAAFEGTVTAVGQGSVTLEVSRWFVGGEADQVVLDVTTWPALPSTASRSFPVRSTSSRSPTVRCRPVASARSPNRCCSSCTSSGSPADRRRIR